MVIFHSYVSLPEGMLFEVKELDSYSILLYSNWNNQEELEWLTGSQCSIFSCGIMVRVGTFSPSSTVTFSHSQLDYKRRCLTTSCQACWSCRYQHERFNAPQVEHILCMFLLGNSILMETCPKNVMLYGALKIQSPGPLLFEDTPELPARQLTVWAKRDENAQVDDQALQSKPLHQPRPHHGYLSLQLIKLTFGVASGGILFYTKRNRISMVEETISSIPLPPTCVWFKSLESFHKLSTGQN